MSTNAISPTANQYVNQIATQLAQVVANPPVQTFVRVRMQQVLFSNGQLQQQFLTFLTSRLATVIDFMAFSNGTNYATALAANFNHMSVALFANAVANEPSFVQNCRQMNPMEVAEIQRAATTWANIEQQAINWAQTTNFGMNVQQQQVHHMHPSYGNTPNVNYNQHWAQPNTAYSQPPVSGIGIGTTGIWNNGTPNLANSVTEQASARNVSSSVSNPTQATSAPVPEVNAIVELDDSLQATVDSFDIGSKFETVFSTQPNSPFQMEFEREAAIIYSGDIDLLPDNVFPLVYNTNTHRSYMEKIDGIWVQKSILKGMASVELAKHLIPTTANFGVGRFNPLGDVVISIGEIPVAIKDEPVLSLSDEELQKQNEELEDRPAKRTFVKSDIMMFGNSLSDCFVASKAIAGAEFKEGNALAVTTSVINTADTAVLDKSSNDLSHLFAATNLRDIVDFLRTTSDDIDVSLWRKINLYYTGLVNRVLTLNLSSSITIDSLVDDYDDLKVALEDDHLFGNFNISAAIMVNHSLISYGNKDLLEYFISMNTDLWEQTEFESDVTDEEKCVALMSISNYVWLPHQISITWLNYFARDLNMPNYQNKTMMVHEDSHPELYAAMAEVVRTNKSTISNYLATLDGYIFEFTNSAINPTMFFMTVRDELV